MGAGLAADVLLQGLKRLEYRGYDSSGVALFTPGQSHVQIVKTQGKITALENLLHAAGPEIKNSHCGIGHTRWATHGRPNTTNAHPHRADHVVLVHNGIIENYLEIRAQVVALGYLPKSETDSELYGFLVLEEFKRGHDFVESARRAFLLLKGACSVVVVSEKFPGLVVGIRNGPPLLGARIDLPKSEAGSLIASDVQAVLAYTNNVYFLENGEMIIARASGFEVLDLFSGRPLKRAETPVEWNLEQLDKQGFAHYMLKEIVEQPTALINTFNGLVDRMGPAPFNLKGQPGLELLVKADEVILVACGTSWHAALLGKYWLENIAGISARVELASEFRYSHPVVHSRTVVMGVSQSGETADTLAVIRDMNLAGVPTIAVTNVRGSTLSREAKTVFYTSAGPEIGVAATKTFLAQALVLVICAGALSTQDSNSLQAALLRLPLALKDRLYPSSGWYQGIAKVACAVQGAETFFFMGRGYSYPIALEGALKLKEIAYLHAEGYAAGELKHGPIAMMDENTTVVVLAPRDRWREKTLSNLQEVKARGAKIVAVGTDGDEDLQSVSDYWISVPAPDPGPPGELLYPFWLAAVLQIFSYEMAILKGTSIDQPRNLAKSVTVE